MLQCLRLAAGLLALTTAAATNQLSTWVEPGGGGPMGNDTTQALEWCTKHKDQISSLSIIGFGPPGARNVTGPQVQRRAAEARGRHLHVVGWG